MTLSRDTHYGKREYLRKVIEEYKDKYGTDYFGDLFKVHSSLGLGIKDGTTKIMAYLTPIKEKETLAIAPTIGEVKESIYNVLFCFYHVLGVRSFNLALLISPSVIFEGKGEVEKRKDFPIIARIVDRGDLSSKTSDMGGMELYASSVIFSDPFKVMDRLQKLIFL